MKKKKVMKIILDNDYYNSIVMYRLIKSSCLDKIIKKIDDNSEENFINLFNHLLNRFDDYFPLLNNVKIVIFNKLLKLDETKKYLLSKYNLNDNNYFEYYENLIKDIFTKTFLLNLDVINNDEINKFINEYTKNDITTLMKKLCFCSDKLDSIYLFENINMKIKRIKSKYHYDNKKCLDIAKKDMIIHYKSIIEDFNNKKEHISYFV